METVARYALGVAALAVICASLALVAEAIRRRALPDWTGAPARLAEAVIGLAALIAILELLGAVGLFRLGPVVVAALLAALATRRWASFLMRRIRMRGSTNYDVSLQRPKGSDSLGSRAVPRQRARDPDVERAMSSAGESPERTGPGLC